MQARNGLSENAPAFTVLEDYDSALSVEELIIRLGDEAPHTHKLNHSIVTIGRDSTNDIVLKTGAVSRHHARLEWRRGVWYVTDLDSTNGTGLDDDKLEPHTMCVFPFDHVVQVGPYELEMRRNFSDRPQLTEVILPEQASVELARLRGLYGAELPNLGRKAFSFSMWPAKAIHNGKIYVAIQNEGNRTQKYKFEATSEAPLSFTSAAWDIEVPAGMEKRLAFLVHADERPLLGDSQSYPFEIKVQSEGRQMQTAAGTVAVESRVSQRMLLFSLMMTFVLLMSYLATVLT